MGADEAPRQTRTIAMNISTRTWGNLQIFSVEKYHWKSVSSPKTRLIFCKLLKKAQFYYNNFWEIHLMELEYYKHCQIQHINGFMVGRQKEFWSVGEEKKISS